MQDGTNQSRGVDKDVRLV